MCFKMDTRRWRSEKVVRCCCRLVTHWYTWALADKKGEQLLKYSQHFTDIMAKRCIAVGQAGCKERWLWLVEESPEAVRRPPQNTSSRRAARWKNKQTPGQQTTGTAGVRDFLYVPLKGQAS